MITTSGTTSSGTGISEKWPISSMVAKQESVARSIKISVVAIGASAGGLAAIREFFEALRPDTGMAFVVVTHLGHGQKSALTKLIAGMTAMPVQEVSGSVQLQRNHVYVRPPDCELTVSGKRLVSRPVDPARHFPPTVIDTLFRSLAAERGNQAIGIIFSGSGSDGCSGLAALQAEGGLTFVQDRDSAEVPELPAAAAGAADRVLSPRAMAEELHRLAVHPYVAAAAKAVEGEAAARALPLLAPIFALIRQAGGPDFALYKPSTIHRRLARRLALLNLEKVEEYCRRLEEDPREVEALSADLLINVTEFFRDPEVFAYLRSQVFPGLVSKASANRPIRVWVPACASGEEAYSLAISLIEGFGSGQPAPPVQIFATDVDPASVRVAREAVYPASVAQHVPAELLGRYFTPVEGGFRVTRQVRDVCVFAVQDVTVDPPFSKMDVVSCRNLLIYLKPEVQQKVLATFHYALNPSGVLILGTAESTGANPSELFRQIDHAQHVYERLNVSKDLSFYVRGVDTRRARVETLAAPNATLSQTDEIAAEADRILVAQYVPPSVIIGPSMEILLFRGSTGRYLEPAPGPATLNLPKMSREGLAIDLRAAIQKARKTHTPVTRAGLRYLHDGGYRQVDVDVIPLRRSLPGHYELIVFRDPAPPAALAGRGEEAVAGKKSPGRGDRKMVLLQRELLATQEDLRSIIAELEANNEQLQSANEEILSSNEELKSTNEELETAKEELQATNEELSTVNEEMRTRHTAFNVANDDLLNVFDAVEAGVLLVGPDLTIRRSNLRAQQMLGLVPADLGRLLTGVKTRLDTARPEQLILRCMETRQLEEREVCAEDGRWYLLRACPYRVAENRMEGAVLTVLDIHDVKSTRVRLAASVQAWRETAEQAPDFLVAADVSGRILFLNRTVASLAPEAAVAGSLFAALGKADRTKVRRVLTGVLASGQPMEFTSGGAKGRPASRTRVTPIRSEDRIVALAIRTERIA
jgi:two-component system CheB/CheR fusion protein